LLEKAVVFFLQLWNTVPDRPRRRKLPSPRRRGGALGVPTGTDTVRPGGGPALARAEVGVWCGV